MNDNPFFATGQLVCRIVGTVFFDLKVKGIHHIPRTGGALIVSNHQSYLDPGLIGSQVPRATSYLGKSELFSTRFTAWLYPKLCAFPVRQGEGDIGAVREAIRRCHEGKALVLFPEGARSADGELQPVQPGVGLIARKAGVPVIPCVIEGSYAAWPKSQKLPRPSPIHIRFGPPMDLKNLKSSAIVKVIEARFATMLAELRGEIGYTANPGSKLVPR